MPPNAPWTMLATWKFNVHTRELVMARFLHIILGALLLSLAGASTYVLVSEDLLLDQAASVYQLR